MLEDAQIIVMRKQFSLLALLLFSLTAGAAPDGINAMLLEGPSDYKCTILLDDQPVVSFSDDYLVITTHMGASVSFPTSIVTKRTYVRDEEATGINNASRFGSILSFKGKYLSLTTLVPSTGVQVYTADGALVSSATTDSRGNVSLSVPEQPGAVYVVKTSTITFKIRKP